MERFLKIVGKGKRGARDLTLEEAREAARLIVGGEAKPAQIGAFLVAERIKTESADEILAFAEVLREASVRLAGPEGESGGGVRPGGADGIECGESDDRFAWGAAGQNHGGSANGTTQGTDRGNKVSRPGWTTPNGCTSPNLRIDCAGPYNGRQRTFCATWPAAFVLAEAGMAVTLHGVREIGPKRGITFHTMLLTRGVDPDRVPLDRFARALREKGVGYAPAERLCPPLSHLHDIREQLGLRTVLNTAEKLLDYGDSPYLAMGIFHRTVAERYGEVAIRLGYERTAVIQGMEGSEDLFIDRPTTVWLAEGEALGQQVIDPDRFGLRREVPELEWTAERQMEMAEAVLDGSAPAAFIDMTVLNAAFRMQLAGCVKTMEEGIALSRELLASGKPRQRYAEWLSLLRLAE